MKLRPLGPRQRHLGLGVALMLLAVFQVSLFAQRITPPRSPAALDTPSERMSIVGSTPPSTRQDSRQSPTRTSTAPLSAKDSLEPQIKANMPFSVVIDPDCGTDAQRMTANVKTLPGTILSLSVVDPDGNSYGRSLIAEIGKTGRLSYSWTIRPASARGRGTVIVAGVGPDRKRGAEVSAPFLIAAPGQCP